MEKYFFINYNLIWKKSWNKFTHMNCIKTSFDFFPITNFCDNFWELFKNEMNEEVNIIVNNFTEVSNDFYLNFHKNNPPIFTNIN